jgi:hypothetical protein
MTDHEFRAEMLRRLDAIDERLMSLETAIATIDAEISQTASEDDITDLKGTIDYFGDLLDQDKRERDLDFIRADMRAAKAAS